MALHCIAWKQRVGGYHCIALSIITLCIIALHCIDTERVGGYHFIALHCIALTHRGWVGITSVALSALVTQPDSAVQLIKRHTPIRPC